MPEALFMVFPLDSEGAQERPQATQFLSLAYAQLLVETTLGLAPLRAFLRFHGIAGILSFESAQFTLADTGQYAPHRRLSFVEICAALTRTASAGCPLHFSSPPPSRPLCPDDASEKRFSLFQNGFKRIVASCCSAPARPLKIDELLSCIIRN